MKVKRATYYNILGLDPGASKEEIRSSFRHLALRYHPDRNAGKKNCHAAFIAVHNAYKVLINEETRKEYDAYLVNASARNVFSQHYSRKQNPGVYQTLSMFSSTLWDLEDLLKEIDNENMSAAMGSVTIYDYVLSLLGYLEDSILNENDRFRNFAAKQSRSKLHIDNFFYLLRMDIEKYLRGLCRESVDGSNGLTKVVMVEAVLIKCIGEIRRCISGKPCAD